MKKLYCVKYGKYRNFKNLKILYIFKKTLIISIVCDKCASKHKRIFKREESIEILWILGLLKIYNSFKSMAEEA